MKIATYNVNSLRKRLPMVLAWLEQEQPDVMCLQETKVQDSEFPVEAIQSAGYYAAFRGMKGYNGVATLTREKPEEIVYGFGEAADNDAVRILQTVVSGVPIVNTYVPQGYSIKSDKYTFKLEWFSRLRKYFEERLDSSRPAVWLGDLNVAPEAIDVYHPERRVNDVDFHIDARNAYKDVTSWGLIDVFRQLHPDRIQYTYWDYFRNAFENNWGWRIDHILATPPLATLCAKADVDLAPRKAPASSDHTVVWAEFT
ncbi:MAG: exodeoxyribonuclease III [Acidobacteriaceae bacterium]|nr:exodeoxyribonuclease III [Acidobacteriaceae bacterium]